MNERKATVELTITQAGMITSSIETKEKFVIEECIALLNIINEKTKKRNYATTEICEETIEESRRLKEWLERAEETKNKITDAFKED